ncbi:hypothetical protein EGM88_08835 [Aureibaculum marinum]|uniref:Outer membrane protein beta-barrel domain-containing protein n=1 Tax=Aureibaculum marinum TaxID=2487930 RepID=A0A3N4NJG8_9FLAO|nr:hypothetical protein [Aureibaculum marinum]RPD96464.1 hypothetical protein EGM88_08835 [Aureibaculum marinum]
MISIRSFIGFCLPFFAFSLNAQRTAPKSFTSSNKGKIFVSWGGNRSSFTNSDITFKGNDYNFTLSNVKSHDKPKGWHVDYINPSRMTIPQTNAKIGYFISENYTIALGVDHMKYVMTQNQTAQIDGEINLSLDEPGASFNGFYNNVPIQLTEDFLKFEHTDGLNYVYSEFSRFDDVSSIFNIKNIDVFQINVTEGIGAGVLYPKTNATLLSKERHDDFHISGYGVSLSAGLHLNFFKYFYLRGDLKGGFIDMNSIRTTQSSADSASQSFFYFQRVISLGGIFRI